MADDLVERVAMILMGRLMVSQKDAAQIWHGMYEPEKEQFRREARAAIAVVLEEAADAVGAVGDHADGGAYINAIRALVKEP